MAAVATNMWEHLVYPRAATGSGTHRTQDSSLSTLLSTLIPFFLISAVVFVVFLIAQKFYERVYVPRTYIDILHRNETTPERNSGLFGWRTTLSRLNDEFVLEHSSIDNYLWLRFFKMLTLMCFVGCLITWPVLFPVNATGHGGLSGLDILTFGNVLPGARYLAHCFIAWIFLAFVMFLITRETLYYVYLRQAYFLSPYMASRISSKTVLYVDVPESCRNERYLRQIFPQARTIYFQKDVKDLQKNVEDRDAAAMKLETGESTLINNFVKKQLKAKKKGDAGEQLVEMDPKKDRPKHKTMPIIGKKVDTIDWSRNELQRLIPEVLKEQNERRVSDWKTESALFIEFETVGAAHTAFQMAASRNPLKMIPREIGMTPDEVIWKNLGKDWWVRKVIEWASTLFVVVLCVWWAIPVAFVGLISNIPSLTKQFPWLGFINKVPPQILGVITGLLPTVLLVVLMSLVPIILSKLAKLFEPTLSAVELKTQSWYFPFQVIQVFLITTFASGAAAVGAEIAQDPSMAATLLAQNLPKASNFYLAYFIYFGLLQAALQFLNLVPLLFYVILGKLLDKTPRKKFNRYTKLTSLGWGSMYPKFTNLGVIALSYSLIAPLVLGFATLGFGFLYLAFRYNMFFVFGTNISTRGRAYGRALQQLTVGIYLSEICLIGLFAIGAGSSGIAAVPLVLMIIFLIGTIVWHMQMRKALGKLTVCLPVDLIAEEYTNLHGRRDDPEKAAYEHNNDSQLHPGYRAEGNAGRANAQYQLPPIQTNDGRGDGGFDRQYQNPHPQTIDGRGNGPNMQKDYSNRVGTNGGDKHYQVSRPQATDAPPPPTGIMGRIKAFFMPAKYVSAATISKYMLSPHLAEPVPPYTEEEREEAFLNPALASDCPVVWIPKDNFGLSRREITDSVREVREGLTITDQATFMDDKGQIGWNKAHLKMVPIYEKRQVY